jgi:hypothetical protein
MLKILTISGLILAGWFARDYIEVNRHQLQVRFPDLVLS